MSAPKFDNSFQFTNWLYRVHTDVSTGILRGYLSAENTQRKRVNLHGSRRYRLKNHKWDCFRNRVFEKLSQIDIKIRGIEMGKLQILSVILSKRRLGMILIMNNIRANILDTIIREQWTGNYLNELKSEVKVWKIVTNFWLIGIDSCIPCLWK